jgi:hypothetical protein
MDDDAKRTGSRAGRRDHEPPLATGEWGWRYHHLGIPTDEVRPGERSLEALKMHVSGFDSSPYGVEWMRFEPDCAVSELVRTRPHIAFEVDDLEQALAGKTLLGEPSSPSPGVTVAMILHDGMAVELLQFDQRPESPPPATAEAEKGGEGATAEAAVLEIFHRIRSAMLRNDAAVLAAHVAEDYRGSDAGGRAHGRQLMLSAYGPGGVKLDAFEVSEVETRSWADTVLVTGVARIGGSYQLETFAHTLRFLDVYARRDGRWQLLASQATDIVEGPPL